MTCVLAGMDQSPALDQLLRSSTSVGANLEEAKAASSKREFIRMCEIALREARESVYWLRICLELGVLPSSATTLRDEGEQLTGILAPVIIKTKRRLTVETVGSTPALTLLFGPGSILNLELI